MRRAGLATIAVLLLVSAACGGGGGNEQPDAGGQADAMVEPEPPCFEPDPAAASTGVHIGAIRWDAWFEEPEWPPLYNRLPLWAHQWFERVPFDAMLTDGAWSVASDRQVVMDQEIDYAVTRGVDYWAFGYARFVTRDYETGQFPPISQLEGYQRANYRASNSLDLYLASAHCRKPRFSLLVGADAFDAYLNLWRPGGSSVSRDDAWQIALADLAAYLARPEQHTTPDGRPILFMIRGVDWGTVWDGDAVLAGQKLEELRQAAVDAGAARPFIVTLDAPLDAEIAVDSFGFDAASSYGWNAGLNDGPEGVEVPFSEATSAVDWVARTDVDLGLDVIPPLLAGWDFRPEIPLGVGREPNGNWFTRATPAEFVAQLDQGIAFVQANPDQTTARSVLIYAWNELAEGGYIMPMLATGSAVLDAIAAYLGKDIPATTPALPPVLVPTVSDWGTGCDGGYGIWVVGADIDADSYIQLRVAQVAAAQEDVIATYADPTREEVGGQTALSICLTGAAERAAFAADGVRVSVVNPQRPSTSTPVVIRLGD